MDRLLEEVEVVDVRGDPTTIDVESIEFDSRRAVAGSLFCCLTGHATDGHDHAPEAVTRGAVALLCERPLDLDVTQAVLAPGQARPAMAKAAAAFYGEPARALLTVGVTGTNGKTTVTHLVDSIFDAHGWPTTVIGTLDGARTTPESPVLQRQLAEARDADRRAVAMEVSSHALTQARVDGIVFDAAVFTNLSLDHLDYHRTMEGYFAAKASLFTPQRASLAVVNGDDPWGRRLLEQVGIATVPFTMAEASDIESEPGCTRFRWRGRSVALPLAGTLHVPNALAAATTAVALGVPEDVVVEGLRAVRPVSGRFEVVPTAAPFTVVVDYAHTPVGLEVALDSARRLAGGHRVLCVFGCGGERDVEKRPAMGAVAARLSDLAVLTSDNPRGEDPQAIIDQVLEGVAADAPVVVRAERRAAIEHAVASARPGDVVVVAGKGHETTIDLGGRREPFDDRQAVTAATAERFGPGPDSAGEHP